MHSGVLLGQQSLSSPPFPLFYDMHKHIHTHIPRDNFFSLFSNRVARASRHARDPRRSRARVCRDALITSRFDTLPRFHISLGFVCTSRVLLLWEWRYIGQLEAFASAAADFTFHDVLRQSYAIYFIDNQGALSSMVRGSSTPCTYLTIDTRIQADSSTCCRTCCIGTPFIHGIF